VSIEFHDVSFTYWQAEEPALQHITLEIPAGQFVAITGPTGAGKSTFLQMLNGLIPHHIPGRMEGEVLVNGVSTRELSVAQLSRQVGLVFEDPDSQIVSLTVEDDVAFGPSNLGWSAEEIRRHARQALEQTRLLGFEGRNPFTLSGGEKQSLAMAGILAMRPQVLALDEPTSMLDPIGRARIVSILKALAAETNTTILVVEQNPELIIELADRVLLFDGGRVIRDGTPQEVYSDVEALQQVGAKLPPMVETFWELRRRGLWQEALPFTVEQAVAALKPRIRSGYAQNSNTLSPPSADGAIVEVREVEHRYGDEVQALQSVSARFRRGETTAIVGQNGSGKSTLAFHLVGILQPTNPQGRVIVDGLDVRTTPLRELIRHINYVFQNPDDQLFQETAELEIEYGLKQLGIPADERRRRLEWALELFGLHDYAHNAPKSLRRGLRTRIAVASVVAMQPEVLVVDEPTTGLDRRESLEIMQTLQGLAESGTTIIFITHEMDLVAQFAQRVLVMHAGKILRQGAPTQIFADLPVLQQASLSQPDIYSLAAALGWGDLSALRTPADLAERIAQLM